jgi:hypothetical protein
VLSGKGTPQEGSENQIWSNDGTIIRKGKAKKLGEKKTCSSATSSNINFT